MLWVLGLCCTYGARGFGCDCSHRFRGGLSHFAPTALIWRGRGFRRGGRKWMGAAAVVLGREYLLGYTRRPVVELKRLTGGVRRALKAGRGSTAAHYSRLYILESHSFIRQTAHKQDGARLTRNRKYFHAQKLCGGPKRWGNCGSGRAREWRAEQRTGRGLNAAQKSAQNVSKNVAVVGGSAAGLLTASVLARQGVAVRVFERIETLEPAERTLIVTTGCASCWGAPPKDASSTKSAGSNCLRMAARRLFELKQPDLIIERRALIQGLAEEARRAGAGLELGRRFHALHSNGRGLMLEVERTSTAAAKTFTRTRLLEAMEW